mgnify:CR=1 FL=1|tara:strand:- start:1056 stop:1304 length:249 start_codon:yes stop_codon:yes gene_type:complete
MKVISTSWNSTKRPIDLDDAVRANIMLADRDGQVERLGEQIENAANMMGRLLTMLKDRRLLRDDDILSVLGDNYIIAEEDAT